MEASFWRKHSLKGFDSKDEHTKKALIDEFIEGFRVKNVDHADQEKINSIKNKIGSKKFLEVTMQDCEDLFMYIRFQGDELSWGELFRNETHQIGPYIYHTDVGPCCILVPQIGMKDILQDKFLDKFNNLKVEAKSGYKNGLELLLDAEQFNYGYNTWGVEGLQITLHHHL